MYVLIVYMDIHLELGQQSMLRMQLPFGNTSRLVRPTPGVCHHLHRQGAQGVSFHHWIHCCHLEWDKGEGILENPKIRRVLRI